METFIRNKPYTGPVRAVVLDWAGTAVDYGCIGPTAVFRAVFAAHGVSVDTAEIRAFMGLKKIDHVRGMTRLASVAAKWREIHGHIPDEDDVLALYDKTEPLMLDCIADHAEPIPGVLETVAALRARDIKIGSSTGYTRSMMEVLTPVAAAKGYAPDAMFCSTDVPAGRPLSLDVLPERHRPRGLSHGSHGQDRRHRGRHRGGAERGHVDHRADPIGQRAGPDPDRGRGAGPDRSRRPSGCHRGALPRRRRALCGQGRLGGAAAHRQHRGAALSRRATAVRMTSDHSEGDINLSPHRVRWQDACTNGQTRAWLEADAKYFLHQSLSTPCLDVLTSCQGALLRDLEGRAFLDFHGNSLHQVGHANPRVIAAIKEQLDTLAFCPRRFTNIPAVELARTLTELAPGDLNKALFAPGGTTAVGMALKLARMATGRHKTISMWGSFHGASLDAISVGGEALFRTGVGPLLSGAGHVPPADPGNCPWRSGGDCDGCDLACARYIEYVMEHEGDVGAVIAEPLRCTTVNPAAARLLAGGARHLRPSRRAAHP